MDRRNDSFRVLSQEQATRDRQISSKQAAVLFIVLGPLIMGMGTPTVGGREYPEWLPVEFIGLCLIVTGFFLFLLGAIHLVSLAMK